MLEKVIAKLVAQLLEQEQQRLVGEQYFKD
jgi:hypothetical protein